MTDEVSSGPVTADDVAELAGVSRWTVNRAFKEHASISKKSRKKVLDAAHQLGYFPDLLAASLASDRSNLVSLLIDDFSNPHKLVMMERLTRILRKNGWDTLLVNTLNDDDTSAALLNASQRRVDAAVLIGSSFDDRVVATALGAQRVKKLIVFARSSVYANTVSVCCSDERAMTEVANYVLGNGYRRPAFLAGPQSPSAHVLRKETFLKRWREVRGFAPMISTVGSYDPEQAYRHVANYLKGFTSQSRPDILVCESDSIAIGAVDAIRHEFGLDIPGDIAVTGFDDVPPAASPNYRLTTYRQPISEMAEGLVRMLKGDEETEPLQNFTGKLIKRESA